MKKQIQADIGSFSVVCHDAGGTNQIIAMIKAEGITVKSVYIEGPGAIIWKNAFPNIPISMCLEDAVINANLLLTGTSWASIIEHNARKIAKYLNIYSVTMLDHWSDYPARFRLGGVSCLPDEFWVVDGYAMYLAKDHFPGKPIKLKRDWYAADQLSKIAPLSGIKKNQLLYLFEPALSCWGNDTSGEMQAFKYFMGKLPILGLPEDLRIELRPHPSDSPGKYEGLIHTYSHFIKDISLNVGSLSDALSNSTWVAGCQSYALVLALQSGRKVFGTLPPWAPKCALPHQGIIHLREVCEQ